MKIRTPGKIPAFLFDGLVEIVAFGVVTSNVVQHLWVRIFTRTHAFGVDWGTPEIRSYLLFNAGQNQRLRASPSGCTTPSEMPVLFIHSIRLDLYIRWVSSINFLRSSAESMQMNPPYPVLRYKRPILPQQLHSSLTIRQVSWVRILPIG